MAQLYLPSGRNIQKFRVLGTEARRYLILSIADVGVLVILVAVSRRRWRDKRADLFFAGVRVCLRDARMDSAVGKSGDKSLPGLNISRLSDYLIAVRQGDTEPAAQHGQWTDCIEISAEGN